MFGKSLVLLYICIVKLPQLVVAFLRPRQRLVSFAYLRGRQAFDR